MKFAGRLKALGTRKLAVYIAVALAAVLVALAIGSVWGAAATIHLFAFMAFVQWVVFVGWYAVRAKWWKSPEGVNIMGVAVAVVLILGLINASYTWPGYAIRPYALTGVFILTTLLGAQRTMQLEHHQRDH